VNPAPYGLARPAWWQGLARLCVAEALKVFTTKLWWALLIPVAVIAGVIGFIGATIAGLPDVIAETGTTAPAVALTVPISMRQTTVFAVVLGVIGGAGEFRHKTITTTYLTGPTRGTVLAAKCVVYAGLGLLYGAATFACCALGALTRSGTDSFPSAADTLVIAAAGSAAVMVWCVLGVGLGMLISNQVAVLVSVLVYVLLLESLVGAILSIPRLGTGELTRYLPGAGSGSLQTDHAIRTFADSFGDEAFVAHQTTEGLVGDAGQLSWWAGGLLFAGYAAAAMAAGWLASQRRDIS